MNRNARYVIWLVLMAVVALSVIAALSFVAFVGTLELREPADPAPAQGIVVLTGGADRLADGLRLLEDGKGQRLLLSGVHRGTGLAELKRLLPAHTASLTCCVDLDHAAGNTRGNAREAALWAAGHGYRHLIVVTASYHLPRVKLEFARQMPGARLDYYPVVPDVAGLKSWWREPALLRILLLEYAKYRLAQLRIQLGLAAQPPTAP